MSGGAGGGGGGGACSACLSAGRELRGLRALAPLYGALLQAHARRATTQRWVYTLDVSTSYEHLSVCWECAALLKRVAEFQRRASYAQRVLANASEDQSPDDLTSTSTLDFSTTTHSFDYIFKHEEVNLPELLNVDSAGVKLENIFKDEYFEESETVLQCTDSVQSDAGAADIVFNEDLTSVAGQATKQQRLFLEVSPMSVTQRRQVKEATSSNCQSKSDDEFSGVRDTGIETGEHRPFPEVLKQESISPKQIVSPAGRSPEIRLHTVETVSSDTNADNIQRNKESPPPEGVVVAYYDTLQLSEEEMILSRIRCKNKEIYRSARFKCESCIILFEHKEHLEDHERTYHTPSDDHSPCDICQVYVPDETMATHRERHYIHYKCVQCGHTDDTEDAIRWHLSQPHNIAHKCSVCQIQFPSFRKMRYHKSTEHRDPVACNVCNRVFKWKPSLNKHMRFVHNAVPPVPCSICKKLFSNKGTLRQHMKRHKQSDELHRCAECDIIFMNEHQLRSHLTYAKKHLGKVKKFECTNCDKKFKSRSEMKIHFNYIHLGEKKFKCDVCDKAFARSNSLKMHTMKIHEGYEGPRNHVCEECGKAFKARLTLATHKLIHTGERPYKCDVCGDDFRQNGALYTHKRLKHLKQKKKNTKTPQKKSTKKKKQ